MGNHMVIRRDRLVDDAYREFNTVQSMKAVIRIEYIDENGIPEVVLLILFGFNLYRLE